MAVCSCSAGVMSHCRTSISRTCSFVPAEMLKPANTDLSRHTALTGHLSCRSSRQYMKPTLTGHLGCRSSRQYIKPNLTGHLYHRSCRMPKATLQKSEWQWTASVFTDWYSNGSYSSLFTEDWYPVWSLSRLSRSITLDHCSHNVLLQNFGVTQTAPSFLQLK